MWQIDWSLFSEMLTGIGTLLTGLAAMVVLPWQLGFRKEAKKLRASLKLMLPAYRQYVASEEGIVWGDYPKDADQIVDGIACKTELDKKLIREMLNEA
jgi:hypothetical protein